MIPLKHAFKSADTGQGQAILALENLREFIPDLPDLDLSHILRLTNSVGIIQHAKFALPNYHHGYCVDDNARALILVCMANQTNPSADLDKLISTYLSYLYYMQNEDGTFRNFLSFTNDFLDEQGSEDSFGRAIWALGFFIKTNTNPSFDGIAKEIFDKAIPQCFPLKSIRAAAYCLLGLIHYHKLLPQQKIINYIQNLANFIHAEYHYHASNAWDWFEDKMTYDNSILPLALFRSAAVLENKTLDKIAFQTALFLDRVLFQQAHISLVGNEKWYSKTGVKCKNGQQPIEIASTLLLYKALYHRTANSHYKDRMLHSFQWFFGKNDLQLSLYDAYSRGCCDGLDRHGVNLNQGAESTISFWKSYLYISEDFD